MVQFSERLRQRLCELSESTEEHFDKLIPYEPAWQCGKCFAYAVVLKPKYRNPFPFRTCECASRVFAPFMSPFGMA